MPQMFEQGPFKRVDPSTGFDQLGGPVPGLLITNIGDPIDVLPGEASRGRLEALRQRAQDARALWFSISDDIRFARAELQKAQSRLKQLIMPHVAGGYGLSEGDDDPADPQVADIKRTIARHEAELSRMTSLEAARVATMHNIGGLVRRCEEFLRDGRPRGTTLTEAALIEIDEVVKRDEKRRDALERLRHRLRELDADAHRINSAPYPSADCKARMREQIETLANRGTPDVSALVEHNAAIAWAQTIQTLPLVAMGEKGAPIFGNAQGETPDVLALFVWLHKPALLASIDGLIYSESDDEHALSLCAREMKLAEIEKDKQYVERKEACLIWHAQSTGDAIEFRNDANVLAVLGIELRTLAS